MFRKASHLKGINYLPAGTHFMLSLIFVLTCSYTVAQQAGISEDERHQPQLMNNTYQAQRIPGTYLSFVSADERFSKTAAPAVTVADLQWKTKAWKGEKVHTKFVIWTTVPLHKITVESGELKNQKGGKISTKNITTGFIRYVMTDGLNKSGGGCGIPKGLDSSLAEDLIDTEKSTAAEANTLQPVWLSVAVPANAKPGTYTGALKVKEGSRQLGTLTYTLEVLNRTLPEPKNWKFHLDLWQNPYAVARAHNVKLWSAEHMKVMRPYMQMLADAGQKAITATIIHDPWNSQTYDVYGSMIKWTRKKDGTWNYDYSVFDKWVSFMKSLGIGKIINCYSMIPWNLKFYYFDEAAGKDTLIIAQPGSAEYRAHWTPMLADFARHLKQKGWFDHTLIAMDERPMEAMQKAIAVIRAADKEFKISLAGAYHPELKMDLFDYCVASNQVIDEATKRERDRLGYNTTYYTCCVEGFPNTFTFSPPAEAAWLGWHAANKGYDGYLRWAYNCWPEHPEQDSRFGHWSAGDTYFVYPGYKTSVRFERLKEGIQDYEKIRLLKEEFKTKNQKEKLVQLDNALQAFDINQLKTRKAGEMLVAAKELINSY